MSVFTSAINDARLENSLEYYLEVAPLLTDRLVYVDRSLNFLAMGPHKFDYFFTLDLGTRCDSDLHKIDTRLATSKHQLSKAHTATCGGL